MTNPRRVRKRYPKMPDVTVDDVDQLPVILRARGETAPAVAAQEQQTSGNKGQQRRFTTYPGEVSAAIAIWHASTGSAAVNPSAATKHYDTRIRYITADGPQILKIVVPAIEFLPPGTRVDVEEQSATGRVRVHRKQPASAKSVSWKRPDLKGAIIALAAILLITAIIGVIGYVVGRSKQPGQQPPPPPGITIAPNGKPVQPGEPGQQGTPSQTTKS